MSWSPLDSKVRLKDYEGYRFGGAELAESTAENWLADFFDHLLAIHLG